VAIGEIMRIKTEIGIGFIREPGVAEEILFHSGSLSEGTLDELTEGQRVEFDHKPYGPSGSKSRATNIRLIRQAG
jgi:cold shock CspA family protein